MNVNQTFYDKKFPRISSFHSTEQPRIHFTQPTSCHATHFQQDMTEQLNGRISHDYLIKLIDVSRLIGKGGGNIKEIQNAQNAHISISKDRDNEWVDLTISGFNQQAIDNTVAMIQRSVAIRPARSSFPAGFVLNSILFAQKLISFLERSTNLFQSKSSSLTSMPSYGKDFNSTQPRFTSELSTKST